LLGITTSDDQADDDGNSANYHEPKATNDQLEKLNKLIGNKDFIRTAIKKKLGIQTLLDMKISDYDSILPTVKKMLGDQ